MLAESSRSLQEAYRYEELKTLTSKLTAIANLQQSIQLLTRGLDNQCRWIRLGSQNCDNVHLIVISYSIQRHLMRTTQMVFDVVSYVYVIFVLKYAKSASDRTFRRPDLSQLLTPVDYCREGIIGGDQDRPPKRSTRTFKNAVPLCQMMAFYEPLFQKQKCIEWAIQDVVVRTSYIERAYLNNTTPFCIFGAKAALCYCAGSNCFRHSWSIVEFLLQLYHNNEKKTLQKFEALFDLYYTDHKAQRKNLWCFLKAFRYRFYGLEIPDLIPHYSSTNLEEDWAKFYEEITRRFPEKKENGDGGKKEGGDEKKEEGGTTKGNEPEKQDTTESSIVKGKKRKDRLLAVAAFMGGFNALTICAIVTFFIWYKSYVKKEKQKQVSLQAVEEQASESTSTTPGAPSPVAVSPAKALGTTPKAAPFAASKKVEQKSVTGSPTASGPPEAPAPAAPEPFVPEGIVPDPAPSPDSLDVKF